MGHEADKGNAAGQGSGDGAQAGKADFKRAFESEREARRTEKAAFEERIAGLEAKVQARQDTEQQRAQGTDLGDITITQDEWDAGDLEAINAKLKRGMEAAAKAGTSALENRWGQMTAAQQADALIGKFEIFHDSDDTDLAEDAAFAAKRAIDALGPDATFEQKTAAVKAQAERFSRYKTQKPDEDAAARTVTPMPTGSGTAVAAHADTKHERPKTNEDARSLASRLARKGAERLGLRWE